jgi:hypothetical protein
MILPNSGVIFVSWDTIKHLRHNVSFSIFETASLGEIKSGVYKDFLGEDLLGDISKTSNLISYSVERKEGLITKVVILT